MAVLRRLSALLLLGCAAALAAFAVLADRAWFLRHVVVPAYYLPPPSWTLPVVRGAAALASLGVLACAVVALRRATAGNVARVGLALVLSVGAAELVLRVIDRPEIETPNPRIEARLGVPDDRTGWSFVPRRSVTVTSRTGRTVRYDLDAYGDRAPSVDFTEDPQAPTLIVAGESVAMGHSLAWKDTFAARLGEKLHLQVVDVAEGGYGSDQAFLRAQDALRRLERPVALVETVLAVQLHRNIQDDRARLVLRDGALVVAPAARSPWRLRELFRNQLPYLSDARLATSLELTRAILRETARAARERGAKVLFVTPSFDPAHADRELLAEMVGDLPHLTVDVDPRRLLPWDGHPDERGAAQIADAIAAALGYNAAP